MLPLLENEKGVEVLHLPVKSITVPLINHFNQSEDIEIKGSMKSIASYKIKSRPDLVNTRSVYWPCGGWRPELHMQRPAGSRVWPWRGPCGATSGSLSALSGGSRSGRTLRRKRTTAASQALHPVTHLWACRLTHENSSLRIGCCKNISFLLVDTIQLK